MAAFWLALTHLDPLAIVRLGGYAGIAFLVFAESGLLVGIFFPGDSLLFAAGLLAGGGSLSYALLILIVPIAAILGDTVGYWFGRRVGSALFSRPDSRMFKQEYLHRAEAFYEKYGSRAIVLARFLVVVRTLAPVIAGVARMHYGRFLAYNIVGGVLWGIGMVSLGYFLGTAVPSAEHYILPLSLGIIVLSCLPIILNLWRGKRAL